MTNEFNNNPDFVKKIHYLNLKFKGQRNYIHSTDIYEAITKHLISIDKTVSLKKFVLSINKLIINKTQLKIFNEEDFNNISKYQGFFKFIINNINYYGILLQTNERVLKRYEHYNDDIDSNSILKEKSIMLKSIKKYSSIETIVEMNKVINNKLFPKKDNKRWFFSKIELNKFLPNTNIKEYKLIIDQNLLNRITKSSIYINNMFYGHLFFSEVRI